MKISRLYRRGWAALAPALLISMPAFADHTFNDAEDLGRTTGWDRSGMEYVGEIGDARDNGYGYEYLKFEVVVGGTVNVWTSGGLSPLLAVYDANRIEVRGFSTSSVDQHLEAGTHYVVAASRNIGDRYRIHLTGGGRGHDDIGNTITEAAPIPSCRDRASGNPNCRPSSQSDVESWDGQGVLVLAARLDYRGDRDWYSFDVPEGPPVWVRIWSSGSTDTYAFLYDNAVQLETDYSDGSGANFFIGRTLGPGTYYVGVYGEAGSYRLHLAGRDDHGNYYETASRILLPTGSDGVPGAVDYPNDWDGFWFQVSTRGRVRIETSGSTDTYGSLYDEYEVQLETDYSDGSGANFLIDRTLDPGIYYVWVRGATGPYHLHLSGDASGVHTVPLLPADGNARGQQGFVRVTNHSEYPAEVAITAVDDTGMRSELSSPLELAPWQTRHFNSGDLERGNPGQRHRKRRRWQRHRQLVSGGRAEPAGSGGALLHPHTRRFPHQHAHGSAELRPNASRGGVQSGQQPQSG